MIMDAIMEKMRREDRLLSESAVMKSVQKAIMELGYEPFGDKQETVYKAIESVPAANGWIPVSSGKLPEKDTHVYATCWSLCNDREPWVADTHYRGDEWGIPIVDSGNAEVIAWRYVAVPEPYKTESEDE